MGKMLLQSLTGTEENENSAAVTHPDENKALSELLQDMKAQLDEASKDLLQPRKEALDSLFRKILH